MLVFFYRTRGGAKGASIFILFFSRARLTVRVPIEHRSMRFVHHPNAMKNLPVSWTSFVVVIKCVKYILLVLRDHTCLRLPDVRGEACKKIRAGSWIARRTLSSLIDGKRSRMAGFFLREVDAAIYGVYVGNRCLVFISSQRDEFGRFIGDRSLYFLPV